MRDRLQIVEIEPMVGNVLANHNDGVSNVIAFGIHRLQANRIRKWMPAFASPLLLQPIRRSDSQSELNAANDILLTRQAVAVIKVKDLR